MNIRPILSSALTAVALAALPPALSAQEGSVSTQEPSAKPSAEAEPAPIHVVRFSGAYADLPEAGGDLTSLLLGGGAAKPKGFYPMLDQLRELGKEEGDTVLVDLTGNFGLNLVQIAELERVMGELRRGGKTCYAYLENGDPMRMQIAALCDKVMMPNLGAIDMPSTSMSIMFMKDAMDLLGVSFDVVRCGDFKGAVEPYMLSSMSSHLRKHYAAMLEKINGDIAQRVATGRHLPRTTVRNAQSQRIFSAKEAKALGLIDHIVEWRDAEHALGTVLGRRDFTTKTVLRSKKRQQAFNPMAFFSQMFRQEEEEEIDYQSLVVLHLSGQIVDGAKAVPGSIVSGPTVKTIEGLIDNDEVKGVVVRINSPGGSATASEAILLALQDLSAKKPVTISMGSLAASGGYYVTCIGRPIFAEAGTITGSIGVFGMRPSLGALMRRVGIRNEIVSLDESAEMTAMDRPWTEGQKNLIQSRVNDIYDVFIGHVARSRGMSSSDVLEIAGGQVWSGEQAVANKLVDRIGGLDDALALIAKEAGIEDSDYEVEHMPRPKSFMDTIAAELMSASIELPKSLELTLAGRLGVDRALRIVLDALDAPDPIRVWALMPAAIELR